MSSTFKLANILLVSPHYTCISRRTKEAEVSFKAKARGAIQHLAIDATGLKVYGEGKIKEHGTDGKLRVWRKLHIAVDTSSRGRAYDTRRYHDVIRIKLAELLLPPRKGTAT